MFCFFPATGAPEPKGSQLHMPMELVSAGPGSPGTQISPRTCRQCQDSPLRAERGGIIGRWSMAPLRLPPEFPSLPSRQILMCWPLQTCMRAEPRIHRDVSVPYSTSGNSSFLNLFCLKIPISLQRAVLVLGEAVMSHRNTSFEIFILEKTENRFQKTESSQHNL